MFRAKCKNCGGTFWETSKGARGEDLCDRCHPDYGNDDDDEDIAEKDAG